jgi:sec-independent protein translocase protein TatC
MNQPFISHVHELRRRLAWSALVLGAGAGLGYLWRDQILDWLQSPLHATLYYTNVTGAFEFLAQACLLVGVLVALPVFVYNLVSFVRPALPARVSNRTIVGVVAASCLLTVAGVGFAYYVSLPAALHFLRTVDVKHLHPLIAADSYLSFVMNYLAVFAIIFQLPLITLFIDRFTPIPPAALSKWRRWVILGSFGAALILPIAPDPVSQLMLALPVVVLYEISIWLVVLAHARRSRRRKLDRPPEPTPGPQRLPMAIAVPNRTRPQVQRRTAMDPIRTPRPQIIDLREQREH